MPKLEEDLFKAVEDDNSDSVAEFLKQGPNINLLVDCGRSILGRAVQLNNVPIVKQVLNYDKLKCDVNISDVYDRTPLHYAAEHGNVEILQLLLGAGCLIDVSDSDNVIPLHLAVSRGHDEFLRILLLSGSQVNRKTSEKSSPLHIASSRGFPSTVNILLRFGAKVDALDSSERTPLLVAVIRGNHAVADVLIKKGAKVNTEEIHGYTPLSEAIWRNDIILVKMLLNAGAKVTKSHYLLHHCVVHRNLRLTELLVRTGCLINIRDDSGNTPLHVAVRTAETALVELLIKYGANVNSPSGIQGSTPLHEAVESLRDSYNEFTDILRLLLRYKCQIDAESLMPGDTPLYRAIIKDKFAIATSLIRHGADVNKGHLFTCNVDNLCMAQRKGNFFLVRLLVLAGFNLRNTPWLEIFPSEINHSYRVDSIKGWLIYVKSNPMRLTDLCRTCLRKRLGCHVYSVVRSLLIPEKIKSYLLLEDIVD